MKKLILFCAIVALAGGVSAQGGGEPRWVDSVEKFNITHSGSGYMDAAAFNGFLDRAEGDEPSQTFLERMIEDPMEAFQQLGLWRTLLFILLGGLALNLTPCVLPMIPVNLALIGAGAQSESRRKGFALGGVYGLGITVVYGGLGLAVVLGGARFGALNANPWFNFGIATVFLVLSLAMFNVIHIDISKLHNHLSRRQVEEEYLAAFGIGGVSALLAGACVAPVVIAVLLLSGNLYAHGVPAGLALPFVLGLGMALPWPFAGAGLSFLPKPGAWMEWVKRGFGVFILLFAFYYGSLGFRLLSTRRAAAQGGTDQMVTCDGEGTCFRDALADAYAARQPVFIDFWADWCRNCHAMDRTTFSDPAVQERLEKYKVLKFDATDFRSSPVKDILDHFGVVGLPTYVILEPIK